MFASCLHDSIKSLGGVAEGHVIGEGEPLLLFVRHGENEFESRLLPGGVRLVHYPDMFESYLNQQVTLDLRISLDYNQCAICKHRPLVGNVLTNYFAFGAGALNSGQCFGKKTACKQTMM